MQACGLKIKTLFSIRYFPHIREVVIKTPDDLETFQELFDKQLKYTPRYDCDLFEYLIQTN